MSTPDEATVDQLAKTIRADLLGPLPEGFRSVEMAGHQDDTLDRLAVRLKDVDPKEIDAAMVQLVMAEQDGWTYLKLVSLCERLKISAAGPALLKRLLNPPAETDERRLFMSGLTAETLLRLELDPQTRARALELSGPPLAHLTRVRASVGGRIAEHQPKRSEVMILVGVMLLAMIGVAVAMWW